MTENSQCAEILRYMQGGGSLTALEALQMFGCLRLAARIQDLEEAGHSFTAERETDEVTGKSYTRYTLVQRITDRDLEDAGQTVLFA